MPQKTLKKYEKSRNDGATGIARAIRKINIIFLFVISVLLNHVNRYQINTFRNYVTPAHRLIYAI